MSEALEVRKQAQPRTLGIHCEKPPPVVPARPAMPHELPAAALSFLRAALGAQWAVTATYGLGWRVDSHGTLTGALRASVALRGRRGPERFVAMWSTGWPIPAGLEPPGLDAPPELAPHLPRGDLAARGEAERLRRVALLKHDVAVRWSFELGAHWTRPAPPLGPREDGRTGWWSATGLKARVTALPS